jgi:hypothetical protein
MGYRTGQTRTESAWEEQAYNIATDIHQYNLIAIYSSQYSQMT